MSNDNLRERIIRLAWDHPGQLRDALLPLVREARSAPAFERKTPLTWPAEGLAPSRNAQVLSHVLQPVKDLHATPPPASY